MTDATPTIPVEKAINAGTVHVTFADGETRDLVCTDADSVDDDAYVNGRYGGTVRSYTCEATDKGGIDHIYHVRVKAERECEQATVRVWEQLSHDQEEELELADAEIGELWSEASV